MPTASELIVQTLEEAGVEYVFGIPGGGTGQIFQLLHGKEDRIKTILVRHEQAAAIMADAYGRATGKPAVVMGQGLFIGSNASLVAPVNIGEGATVAAGSTVTKTVENGALAVARGRQVNLSNWKRPVKKTD